MAATAVGQWADALSSRHLLIDDFLWVSKEWGTAYITPYWTEDKHPRYKATPWLTGSKNVGFQRIDMPAKVRSRRSIDDPSHLHRQPISTIMTTVVSQLMFAGYLVTFTCRNGTRDEEAASRIFEYRWLVHATLKDMSWLSDRRGLACPLNGTEFERGPTHLVDTMTWTTIQMLLSCFCPRVT